MTGLLRLGSLASLILLTGLFLIGVGFVGPSMILTVFLALGGAEYALKIYMVN